jgi:predicted Zn-dependent protease
MKSHFRFVPLVALSAGLLVGAPAPSAHAGIFSVSPAQEKKIGQQAGADIEKGAPIVTGPVADWVNRVGQRLAKASNPEFEYSFHVIDSPEINAFCLPGGHIFVYTGLRKVVKTDDELASVLAHEITHAEEHHYAKQYGKNSKRQTILGIGSILLGLPGIAQQGLGLLDAGLSAKYSRGSEAEADREGAARMKRAGFDPTAMVTVLTRLSNEDSSGGLDKWLSDHPQGKKRAAAVQALIPALPAASKVQ